MTGLREEFEFLTEFEPRSLVVVDELNALDDLVVKLLNQPLRTEVALVIKLVVRDSPQILYKVLPQALAESPNILSLPKLFHIVVSRLNTLVVV